MLIVDQCVGVCRGLLMFSTFSPSWELRRTLTHRNTQPYQGQSDGDSLEGDPSGGRVDSLSLNGFGG